MPTTSPDSIYYADGTTPASIATITAAIATSVQNALNVRELKSYSWADSAAKSAQTGMSSGEIGYQIDNATYYIYSGSWLIWAKAQAAYAPTLTSFGASSSSFIYSVSGGRVFVTGKATLNSAVTGVMSISTPSGYNINTTYLDNVRAATIGSAGADDGSSGNDYPLLVRVSSSTSVSLAAQNASGTNLTTVSTAAGVPFTWASGDIIYVNFSYPVA